MVSLVWVFFWTEEIIYQRVCRIIGKKIKSVDESMLVGLRFRRDTDEQTFCFNDSNINVGEKITTLVTLVLSIKH